MATVTDLNTISFLLEVDKLVFQFVIFIEELAEVVDKEFAFTEELLYFFLIDDLFILN